ncbi:MAG: EAL domain-containing protein [Chloroflexota bacterium]
MMLEAERVLEVLHRFRKLGIGIAIDNFGTGYSSLSYLSRLPVDEIKIDKSFVMAVAERGNRAIVESVIELGRAFDLRVVAEGLKNEATLQAMTELGCPVAQGFHFSAPVPADSFKQWTEAWARA